MNALKVMCSVHMNYELMTIMIMIDDEDDNDDDDQWLMMIMTDYDWWWWWWRRWWWYGGHFLVYLTIIPRVHVGYEMVHVDSQRGV